MSRPTRMPCLACSPTADQLFVGTVCSNCQAPIVFTDVSYQFVGRATQRSRISAEDRRAAKNARRQAKRAAMTIEERRAHYYVQNAARRARKKEANV